MVNSLRQQPQEATDRANAAESRIGQALQSAKEQVASITAQGRQEVEAIRNEISSKQSLVDTQQIT